MVRTTWEIMDKDESFMKALGKITSRYALLEELIIGCINILIGGECASIVTAGLPFSRSLTILGALYRQKYNIEQEQDYPEPLKSLLTQAGYAEEERNIIIHSMWQSTRIKELLIRTKRNVSRKKGLRIDRKLVRIKDLNDVADIIQNAVEAALFFTYEILARYIPTLISPADGSLVDTKPELSWLPVEGTVGYEVAISVNPGFTELAIFKSDATAIRNSTYTCEITLQRNRTYYWRVQPIIATEKGYYSEIRSFIVQ